MALRAGYYGLKKSLLNKVKGLPGIKSIGSGLSLNSTTGELTATGTTVAIEANPEGSATDNLIKLGIGEDIYAVPDAAKTYQTDDATESAIVDADYIPFLDNSAASGAGAPKKSTWSNFKSKLKMVFDALYMTWEANARTGAVNRLEWNVESKTQNNVTFTVNEDKTVTISTTAEGASADTSLNLKTYTATETLALNGLILTGCPSGGGNDKYRLVLQRNESPWSPFANDTGDGATINSTSAPSLVYIQVKQGQIITTPITFKPMMASDINAVYAPYAMTNRDLTENKLDKTPKILTGVSLNDITENGKYLLSGNNISDSPISYGYLDVMNGDGVFIIQILYSDSNTDIFKRTHKQNDGWSAWYKYTGTATS